MERVVLGKFLGWRLEVGGEWCMEFPCPLWVLHLLSTLMGSPTRRFFVCFLFVCVCVCVCVCVEASLHRHDLLNHWPLVIGLISSPSSLPRDWGVGLKVPTLNYIVSFSDQVLLFCRFIKGTGVTSLAYTVERLKGACYEYQKAPFYRSLSSLRKFQEALCQEQG